jgi:N-acetylmuramoyl-L-alanine amidase
MRIASILFVLTTLLTACSSGDAEQTRIDSTAMQVPTRASPAPTIELEPLTVVLDPGHGGGEVGASAHGVVEKDSNLDMARRVQRLLEATGVRAILTRTGDTHADGYTPDPSLSGRALTRQDLQARVDLANEHDADLFISLHSNGSTSTAESGVEVWYDPNREFGDDNERLATGLQRSLLDALAVYGYQARNRGIKDDTCFRLRRDRCRPLYVLGPARTDVSSLPPPVDGRAPFEASAPRATGMPGALVELLFISNTSDAAVLADPTGRDAVARGLADAVVAFLNASPDDP